MPEYKPNIDLIIAGFENILKGLGVDWLNDPHMDTTPERAAKAWFNEICAGLTQPPPKITTFPSDSNDMVVLRDIPVRSVCSHHLLPFIGTACVGYIPGNGKILGLSKLSRIVDYYARRPQVQEELTTQIADAVVEHLDPMDEAWQIKSGVGVIIKATHMCMLLRGVNHPADMITSSLRGRMFEGDMRSEFLALAGMSHG